MEPIPPELTLLDWFAGQALKALAPIEIPPCDMDDEWCDDVAGAAYRYAKAMMDEKRRLEDAADGRPDTD